MCALLQDAPWQWLYFGDACWMLLYSPNAFVISAIAGPKNSLSPRKRLLTKTLPVITAVATWLHSFGLSSPLMTFWPLRLNQNYLSFYKYYYAINQIQFIISAASQCQCITQSTITVCSFANTLFICMLFKCFNAYFFFMAYSRDLIKLYVLMIFLSFFIFL